MKIFSPKDKILANFDYTRQLIEMGYSPPVLVEIDPSNMCNHGCAFCLSSHIHFLKNKHKETFNTAIMPREILMAVVEDLIKIKVKAINWTGGGEPTLNRHLKEAIIYLGEHSNIKMGMFTNGTLLDKFEFVDALVNHMTWVRFSIDATEVSYDRIRQTNGYYGWKSMLRNLNSLIEANQKSNHKIDIGLGFVITPDNYQEVVEFANYFKDFDVTYCQFKPEIVNIERDNGNQRDIWIDKVIPYLDEAKDILKEKFQINDYKMDDLTQDPIYLGRTYTKCLGSQLTPCIGADGNVYVCPNLRGYPKFSYGSVYQKSFIDIWRDTAHRRQIMKIIEEDERFLCCSKLCKNHESNKKLWKIYCQYQQAKDKETFLTNLNNISVQIQIKHPEFI